MSGAGDRVGAPWHLWLVGVVALLWNGLGCLDYTMTQVQGDAWLARMDPSDLQMAYFHGMPAWTDAAWAIYAWGGLVGALLLLMRRKPALAVFTASFFGWAAGAVYTVALSDGLQAMGPWWPVLIIKGVAAAVFVWCASAMSRTGVLR